MASSRVFFVGSPSEVDHHASPLMEHLAVTVIDAAAVVELALAGDVAIFFSEHFDRFRQSVIELKRNNVATIYMIDGILEWRNAWENDPDEIACPFTMRPVLSHKVACIGEDQARIIAGWGNAGKTEIVGVPRFDCYGHVGGPLDHETIHRDVDGGDVDGGDIDDSGVYHTGIKTDRIDKPFRVLVMTAKTPAFTDGQWAIVRRSLSDCKTYFDQHADRIEVTWRLTGGLDDHIGVTNTTDELTGVQLRDQLRQVDAVISTPSTAVVEAMLADKPTALLDYFDCPSYLNPAWRIAHASQIDKVVKQLQQPSAALMHFQRQQRQHQLYTETSATGRVVQLVRAMQDSAAQQLADGVEKISFGEKLLPPPASSMVQFNWQAMFPGNDGNDGSVIDGTDIDQTRAQLAHARRHVSHLDRRIEQLESELKQAHEIFEQIHRHPIAGPIVRIRERLLGMLSKDKDERLPETNTTTKDNDSLSKPSEISTEGDTGTRP